MKLGKLFVPVGGEGLRRPFQESRHIVGWERWQRFSRQVRGTQVGRCRHIDWRRLRQFHPFRR